MKCELCNGETEILKGQTWHYVESGFDNVYLRNIEVRTCLSCDAKSPRFPRILELHAAILKHRSETLNLVINVDNPRIYSYRST